MTFQRNIPQPGDLISVSQDNLLQNFQAINDSYNVNHVLFNLAGDGKHKFVEMPTQTSDPAGAASEITLFSRTQTLPSTGIVDLWYKRNAEATAFQLTGQNPVIGVGPTFKSSTFLPGGLILKYGKVENPSDGLDVTFDSAFPNAVFVLTFAISRNGTSSTVTYYTALVEEGFKIRTNNASNDALTYIAIGN